MTRRLCIVLADFLDLLADSTEPVQIGEAGPPDRYSPKEAKAIGQAVRGLADSAYIKRSGILPSSRPPSKGRIVRGWLPLDREACCRKAQEYRQEAKRMPDDDSPMGFNQQTLF